MDGPAPEAPKTEKAEKKEEQKTSPVTVNPPTGGNPHTTVSFNNSKPAANAQQPKQGLVQLATIKPKKVTEMTEEELIEKNEDIQMEEKRKKEALQEKFR